MSPLKGGGALLVDARQKKFRRDQFFERKLGSHYVPIRRVTRFVHRVIFTFGGIFKTAEGPHINGLLYFTVQVIGSF
jgi:hypothetical protein